MPKAKSWAEHKAECESVAKEGITILGFVEPWRGCWTKLILHCDKHGEWRTTSIDNFKRSGSGSCPKCANERRGYSPQSGDETCISEFMSTGAFKDGTTFTRSDTLDTRGYKPYWYVSCPVCSNDEYTLSGVCSGVFEVRGSNLKTGKLPCRCAYNPHYTKQQWEFRLDKACTARGYKFIEWKSEKFRNKEKFTYACPLHGLQTVTPRDFLMGSDCPQCAGHNQQEAYVYKLTDEEGWTCLKFGIAKNSARRVTQQKRRARVFSIEILGAYKFPTVKACRGAENSCKQELVCKILTKSQLPDGYTETTSIQNLDKIIEIYERFGGVRIK